MSDAAAAFGGTIPLPNTAQLSPSDIGTVWVNQTGDKAQTAVTVTFPSRDVILTYQRPAPSDPVAYFQAVTSSVAGSKLIWLGNTPASYSAGSPSYWATIDVIAGGADIGVLGHGSEAALEAIAQSIVDQASADTTGK